MPTERSVYSRTESSALPSVLEELGKRTQGWLGSSVEDSFKW